jgi:hypothetical protein
VNASTGELETAEASCVSGPLSHLYTYLRETGAIVPIREFDQQQLHISPADVLQMIQTGQPEWESLVPAAAAKLIRERALFGYRASGAASI